MNINLEQCDALQPPAPPEIEGYLKKLKRKTSSFTSGWNRRWFYVDCRKSEFCYSKTKTGSGPISSIHLNDIMAIVQYDETHFQVESRSRNFFLRGESKASTSCWVSSLDTYRRKYAEYEKKKFQLAIAAAQCGITNVNDKQSKGKRALPNQEYSRPPLQPSKTDSHEAEVMPMKPNKKRNTMKDDHSKMNESGVRSPLSQKASMQKRKHEENAKSDSKPRQVVEAWIADDI